MNKLLFLFFFFTLLNPNLYGFNQLRIDDFNWQIAQTPNFNIYHYPLGDDEILKLKPLIDQFEWTHREVSNLLNVVFPEKSPVFLFYNHNHFLQNRIAAVGEGTEAFAEVFKNRIVIPTRYSRYEMDHLIAHEFVHIAQFEILYGGFWRSPRLIKMLSGLEPLWIIEGMAENIAHTILKRQWSSYDKMILRDAVMYDYLYNLRQLQNFNALYRHIYLGYKIGHSAIDFLVKEEGENINFRLLKSLRNNMDPVKAFEEVAEKFASLRDFNLKWEKDIKERVKDFIKDKKKVSEISEVLVEDFFHSRNPVPDGVGGFYYVSDRHLTNEIFHYSNGKDKKIFDAVDINIVTGRRFDRIIDYNPFTGLLTFFAKKNQKNYLFMIQMKKT